MLTTVNRLSAYLYLHMEDGMPDPVLDEEGNLDVEADNQAIEAWSSSPASVVFDTERLQSFLIASERLINRLESFEAEGDEPLAKQYMTLFYDAAKETFDGDKTQLRVYFMWLYYVIYGYPEGARWGEIVEVYGAREFASLMRERFAGLVSM